MSPFSIADTRPTYDRARLKTKIVHLGFGAFHRAHQGLFTDEVARRSGSDWGICEISLFSDTAIKALQAQECLYSVIEKGADATEVKIIRSVMEAMTPNLGGVAAVIEKMAEPQVAIVSLTITEKGYCIDPATGLLDLNNPSVNADQKDPNSPQTALGYVTAALKLRRDRGLPPLSILSCDNIQENGHIAKAALTAFARLSDPDLADWIDANITFPCTMVDRIVPAVTEETAAEIAALLGAPDPCGVACEPFNQWVIEDKFAAGRPDWDIAGATFVQDVLPYEEMKLRMLNGAHSFLAYLGYLAGYAHISDTMADPHFRNAAYDLMTREAAPSLQMPEGTDLEGYARQLIERFSNPGLKHKTWQIAMDGSQKIPQRFGGSLRYHVERGSDFCWIATGIAGWMRYVFGVDEHGQPIDVKDPMADMLRERANAADPVRALLSIETIFDSSLATNPTVITKISNAYTSLVTHGAKATVAAL